MGRSPRITKPGIVYHLLNRRVMRLPLFKTDEDYLAFERVLAESLDRPDAPDLLSWCIMPNHWHLVVQARRNTNLSTWMQRVTVTHTHRWHAHSQSAGEGPLYQGRFKSFPVQEDRHFLTLCRYVEANARRAKLVKQAQAWRWCSLWVRSHRTSMLAQWLCPWPVNRPRTWLTDVNRAFGDHELKDLQLSITRGVPLGTQRWRTRIANRLELASTLRSRGRPKKEPIKSS